MMPTMTGFDFGDLVLVPFPFSNQSASKKRPAVIVSSARYHRDRRDLIILAVTSQVRPSLGFGERPIQAWESAGLLKPSVLKPLVATIERGLVLRRLGQLGGSDLAALRQVLGLIIGA